MFSNSSGLKRVFEKLCFDNGFFARGRPNLINIAAVLNLSGDVWTEGGVVKNNHAYFSIL